MVMRQMRENTKPILWVAVISFVLTIFAVWGLDLQTGSGSSDPNVIGRVNGVPITRSQYQLTYEQFAQQMRMATQNQSGLTYDQQEFLHSQTWDNLVYSVLTDQQIERLGITVTDDEIVAYLRNTPPPEIRQYFVDDQGNFDHNAYLAALHNPEIDWSNLEQVARERIPRLKLNEYLSAQVHVSEEEIRTQYEAETTMLSLRYVAFDAADQDAGDYQPTDEEIARYHQENAEDFMQPDKARVVLLQIAMEPGEDDVKAAEEAARGILMEDIREGGRDFGAAAEDYSEAATAYVQGNTGFLTRAQRDSTYFDALDAIEPGETTGPVLTEDGFYLLKLIEKREGESGEMEYNAQEILITPQLSLSATDRILQRAEELLARAKEVGLEQAAQENGLELLTPIAFAEGAPIPGFGFVPSINRFAFNAEPGDMSTVLRDEDNAYIVRLEERIAGTVQPIEETRSYIVARLQQKRRQLLAERQASAFSEKALSTSFDQALATYGLTPQVVDTLRVAVGTDEIEPFSPIGEAALRLERGSPSPPIPDGSSRYVVIEVYSRTAMDREDYGQRIPAVRRRLHAEKVQTYIAQWYQQLRDQATIEDYRTQS